MTGDADQELELWRQLASAQRQVTRDLNRTLYEEGAHPATWIDVLNALAETAEGRAQSMSLARRVGDRRGMTVLLKQMADAGLIRVEPHHTDRRRRLVILTPYGRRELQKDKPRYRDAIRQTGLGNLTASEGHAFRRLLAKVSG